MSAVDSFLRPLRVRQVCSRSWCPVRLHELTKMERVHKVASVCLFCLRQIRQHRRLIEHQATARLVFALYSDARQLGLLQFSSSRRPASSPASLRDEFKMQLYSTRSRFE
jgi:hypothetical protein